MEVRWIFGKFLEAQSSVRRWSLFIHSRDVAIWKRHKLPQGTRFQYVVSMCGAPQWHDMREELTFLWPTAYKGGTELTEGRPGSTPTSQSTRLVALLPHSDDYTQLTVVAYICYNLSKFTTMAHVRYDFILLPVI